MKVGTDGVLLGAWARVLPGPARYLDIGTGTGGDSSDARPAHGGCARWGDRRCRGGGWCGSGTGRGQCRIVTVESCGQGVSLRNRDFPSRVSEPLGAAGTRRAYRMAVKRLLPETVPKKESRQQSLPNCFITISFPIRRGSWIRCPLPMRDAGWPATPIRSLMANCCSMLPVCWRRRVSFSVVLPADSEERFSRQGPRRRVRTEPSYTCLYPSRNISQARLARIRFRRKLRGDARRRHPDNRDRRGPWELYG